MNYPSSSVPMAQNDNQRKIILVVGFDDNDYLDIAMSLQECGLPFDLAHSEISHDADYFLQAHNTDIVAVIANHHMDDKMGYGLKWLNKRKHQSLADIPTIAVVDNSTQAAFAQANDMADSSIVAHELFLMDGVMLFNALADATVHAKAREVPKNNQDASLA